MQVACTTMYVRSQESESFDILRIPVLVLEVGNDTEQRCNSKPYGERVS